MANSTTEESKEWDENDMGALEVLQLDAYTRRVDGEVTAKAFRAIETITEVVAQVIDDKADIADPDVFIEQLSRLAAIVRDYYAARPEA